MPTGSKPTVELLPLDEPQDALDLLRRAACRSIISVSPTIKHDARQWQQWIAEDLENTYHYPHTLNLGRVAARCAGIVHRYLTVSGQDKKEVPRPFLTTVGALLTTDMQGFKDLHVLRPDKVGAYQPEEMYWFLLDFYETDTRVDPQTIKHCLYSRPHDPGGAIEDYLKRMEYCYDSLLPALRSEYGYTGPVPDAMVKRFCQTTPRNFQTGIRQWFATSFAIARELGDEVPRLTLKLASPLAVRGIKKKMALAKMEAAETNGQEEGSNAQDYLGALRAMYAAEKVSASTNLYNTTLAKLLRRALSDELKDMDGFTAQDIKWAAGYIGYSVRHYNRLHPDDVLPVDMRSLKDMALAYLADKQVLEAQGVPKAHAIAHYHDTGVYKRLRDRYKQVPRFIIKTALRKNPSRPAVWLDRFLVERTQVLQYVYERTGFDIEIELANYIAAQNAADMSGFVDAFLGRYEELLVDWSGDDDAESWMLRRAALFSPRDTHRAVRYFKALARKGYYRRALDAPVAHGSQTTGYNFVASAAADPLEEYIQQEDAERGVITSARALVYELMKGLLPVERAAVKYVFGIELPDTPEYDEDELQELLQVSDIGAYVMERLQGIHIAEI